MVVIQHLLTTLINIRSKKLLRTTYNCSISALQSFTTSTYGCKEIIIAIFFMNICSFIGCPRYLTEFSTFLYRKSVIRQFNTINSTETTPEEIFLSSILHIERIYGILHIDFIATEHFPMILKRAFRLIGSSTSDATGPLASPNDE